MTVFYTNLKNIQNRTKRIRVNGILGRGILQRSVLAATPFIIYNEWCKKAYFQKKV